MPGIGKWTLVLNKILHRTPISKHRKTSCSAEARLGGPRGQSASPRMLLAGPKAPLQGDRARLKDGDRTIILVIALAPST